MEYCDLGSLDNAISDGRFEDLVSQFPLFEPVNTLLQRKGCISS